MVVASYTSTFERCWALAILKIRTSERANVLSFLNRAALQLPTSNRTLSGDVMENLIFRKGTVDDATALRKLFVVAYGLHAHPCQSRSFLLKQLCSDSNLWIIALIDGVIIGCGCIVRHAWNQTWEFSFGVIDPKAQRLGVLTKMIGRGFSMLKAGPHELGFHKPRSTIAHSGALKNHSSVLVGHDGAQEKVYGQSEYHMFAVYPVLQGNFDHVSPDYPFDISTIKDDIYTPLGLRWRPGIYPPLYFVGQAGVSRWGKFFYTENKYNNALSIGFCYSAGMQKQEQVFDELMRFLCFKKSVECFSACVLADKQELVARMLDIGFKITAYLPAWFFLPGCRYDCVMLVFDRRVVALENNGFEKEIQKFNKIYAELGKQMVTLKQRFFSDYYSDCVPRMDKVQEQKPLRDCHAVRESCPTP